MSHPIHDLICLDTTHQSRQEQKDSFCSLSGRQCGRVCQEKILLLPGSLATSCYMQLATCNGIVANAKTGKARGYWSIARYHTIDPRELASTVIRSNIHLLQHLCFGCDKSDCQSIPSVSRRRSENKQCMGSELKASKQASKAKEKRSIQYKLKQYQYKNHPNHCFTPCSLITIEYTAKVVMQCFQ